MDKKPSTIDSAFDTKFNRALKVFLSSIDQNQNGHKNAYLFYFFFGKYYKNKFVHNFGLPSLSNENVQILIERLASFDQQEMRRAIYQWIDLGDVYPPDFAGFLSLFQKESKSTLDKINIIRSNQRLISDSRPPKTVNYLSPSLRYVSMHVNIAEINDLETVGNDKKIEEIVARLEEEFQRRVSSGEIKIEDYDPVVEVPKRLERQIDTEENKKNIDRLKGMLRKFN